ncbi:MAG: glycosyltransferase family 39 protein, partial [Chloroflexota bacterium]|nr:glycosyltransferase family 39 protein [Chloroflexota bacterium]
MPGAKDSASASARVRLRPLVIAACLIAIIGAAAAFRLLGLNWDSGQHLHPDERFIIMVDTAIRWPSSVGQYFDSAHSPLNPYNRGFSNFVYGTLPLFLLKAVASLIHRDSYDGALLVGRALSALSDLGSVLLLYLAGRRLYRTEIGLLAAALLGLSVLGIQLSHFMAVDTFTVFFLMLSFYFSTRLIDGGGWKSAAAMGFSFGLALACKLSIALAPLLMVTAIGLRLYQRWPRGRYAESPSSDGQPPEQHDGDGSASPGVRPETPFRSPAGETLLNGVWMLLIALAAAFIAFRLFQPYAFSGPVTLSPKWLQDEQQQRAFIAGTADVPFLLQWAHTTPFIFPIKDIVVWGMGWPLGLLCFSGLAAAAVRIFRQAELEHLPAVLWVLANLLYLGAQQSKTMRYFYQLYPFLALLSAWLVFSVAHHQRGLRAGEDAHPTGWRAGEDAHPTGWRAGEDAHPTVPFARFRAAKRLNWGLLLGSFGLAS